jgi:hypothetical protein
MDGGGAQVIRVARLTHVEPKHVGKPHREEVATEVASGVVKHILRTNRVERWREGGIQGVGLHVAEVVRLPHHCGQEG